MSPRKKEVVATNAPFARAKAMTHLQEAVAVLDRLIMANPDDVEGLYLADQLLEQMGKDIGVVREQANHLAVQALEKMPDREMRSEDLRGSLSITATPKRVWDDDKVDSVLVIAAERAVEKAIEYGDNPARAAVKAVKSVLTKAAPKLTALKAFAVEPDDISRIEWGKRSVKFTPITNELPQSTATPSPSKTRKSA